AFEFVKTMQTKTNAQKWYVANSGIAVREDGPPGAGRRRADPGSSRGPGPRAVRRRSSARPVAAHLEVTWPSAASRSASS
uniref:hypothetical protein n=1 Tax=Streptomyces pseudogriseolus TaxID=36817 RepID=UPI00117BED8E